MYLKFECNITFRFGLLMTYVLEIDVQQVFLYIFESKMMILHNGPILLQLKKIGLVCVWQNHGMHARVFTLSNCFI